MGTIENRNVDTTLTKTYVVEYDFETGIYKKNHLDPKVDYPIVFKIKNINRWAYKIQVKSKDSVLALSYSLDELSSDLAKVDGKSQKNLGKKETNAAVNNSKTASTNDLNDDFIKQEKKGKHPIDTILKAINMLYENEDINTQLAKANTADINFRQELDTLIKHYNATHADKPLPTDITELNPNKLLKEIKEKLAKTPSDTLLKEDSIQLDLINTIKEKATKQAEFIKQLRKQAEALKDYSEAFAKFNTTNGRIIETFEKVRTSYHTLLKITAYNNHLYGIINNPQFSQADSIAYKQYFKAMQSELPLLNNEIDHFKTLYYDLVQQYADLKQNYRLYQMMSEGGLDKLFERPDHLKNVADKMNKNIDEDKLKKILVSLETIIRSLEKKGSYEWVSAPIEPTKDVVIFDVNIQKRNKNDDNPLFNERKFRHKEFTYGGVRIDLGLGLGISYFGNTPVYELSMDSINNVSITQRNDHLTVPSLIGLATMSFRRTHDITFGGSAGLGIDVVNGKIQLSNFFAGPSIIFGRYDRITFTSGASIRNVQQLKAGYNTTDSVTGSATDDISNFLTDKYKLGWFLSLTYNLTEGVKDNIKTLKSFY